MRTDRANKLQKIREWIAFDVQFQPRAMPALRAYQLGQFEGIARPGMPLIGARMHGQAMRAGVETNFPGADDVGQIEVALIAQQGDLVEIDAEYSHDFSLAGGLKERVRRRLAGRAATGGCAIPGGRASD